MVFLMAIDAEVTGGLCINLIRFQVYSSAQVHVWPRLKKTREREISRIQSSHCWLFTNLYEGPSHFYEDWPELVRVGS